MCELEREALVDQNNRLELAVVEGLVRGRILNDNVAGIGNHAAEFPRKSKI